MFLKSGYFPQSIIIIKLQNEIQVGGLKNSCERDARSFTILLLWSILWPFPIQIASSCIYFALGLAKMRLDLIKMQIYEFVNVNFTEMENQELFLHHKRSNCLKFILNKVTIFFPEWRKNYQETLSHGWHHKEEQPHMWYNQACEEQLKDCCWICKDALLLPYLLPGNI